LQLFFDTFFFHYFLQFFDILATYSKNNWPFFVTLLPFQAKMQEGGGEFSITFLFLPLPVVADHIISFLR